MRGIPLDVAARHLQALQHVDHLRREAELVRLLAQRPRPARWRWWWGLTRLVPGQPAAEQVQ